MRLIVVAGLPSSGTSMVAGVLHHLGVDMGNVPSWEQERARDGSRRYRGFECETAKRMIGGLPSNTALDAFYDTASAYIAKRLDRAKGPVGVKLNLLSLLGLCDGLEELPLSIVHVRRNLEDTFESDIKYTGADVGRASDRGVLHLALREMVRRVPAVLMLDYERTLKWPHGAIWSLIGALDLKTTVSQRDAAIAFIDPVKCKWEGPTA